MEMMNSLIRESIFRNSPQVIAFDCDGVLFDSREANIHFYSHILAEVGRPPVRPDQVEYIHMYPVRESLKFLLGSGSSFDKAWNYFQQIDFEPFNSYLQFEPGLIDVLAYAKSSFRTALATNRTASTLKLLARYDLQRYFDLVVSASDVAHPKPHPDIMDKILSSFGVSPEEIVYVGDSSVDESFAANTGVFFVAYKNPALKADLHIGHLDDLRLALKSYREAQPSNSETP